MRLLFFIIYSSFAQMCIAQNAPIFAYFKVYYPVVPSDIAALRNILQKNSIKTVQAVYQFEKNLPNSPNTQIIETHSIDRNGKVVQSATLTRNLPDLDTTNLVVCQVTESTNSAQQNVTTTTYKNGNGDAPNYTEIQIMNANKTLRELSHAYDFRRSKISFDYDTLQRVRSSTNFLDKMGIGTNYYWQTTFRHTKDSLIGTVQSLDSTLPAPIRHDLYVQRDTILYHYTDTTAALTATTLCDKYWLDKQWRVVRHAIFLRNPSLPERTFVYQYYPSNALRSVFYIKGAGNVQQVRTFLPTGEPNTQDLLEEHANRIHLHDPNTGLPKITELYNKGVKTGEILYNYERW
jgi:hypothetical protein